MEKIKIIVHSHAHVPLLQSLDNLNYGGNLRSQAWEKEIWQGKIRRLSKNEQIWWCNRIRISKMGLRRVKAKFSEEPLWIYWILGLHSKFSSRIARGTLTGQDLEVVTLSSCFKHWYSSLGRYGWEGCDSKETSSLTVRWLQMLNMLMNIFWNVINSVTVISWAILEILSTVKLHY